MKFEPFPAIQSALEKCPDTVVKMDKEIDAMVGPLNKTYISEFKKLELMASVGMIFACTEWLYFLLEPHFNAKEKKGFSQLIDAYWVYGCTLPRRCPPYFDLDVVKGRAQEPHVNVMLAAITYGWDAMTGEDSHDASVCAGFVVQLCEFALPKKTGFEKWRKETYKKLLKALPSELDEDDAFEVQVCRDFFDPNVKKTDCDVSCKKLLKSKLGKNPYLPLEEFDDDDD